MKRREISATGTINNDGRLVMFMGELNEFFARHKGCRVVARFEVAPAGSSAALRGYYYNYIVPTMREAFRETGGEADGGADGKEAAHPLSGDVGGGGGRP